MKMYFISKTRSGKLATWLGIVLVLTTALELIFAYAIRGNSDVVANSPLLAILVNALSIIFTLSGLLSFAVGIYTIIKHEDMSVFRSLAALYALAFIMFLIGEFLFPH